MARACFAAVAVGLCALHVLRQDLDPRSRHLSEYAVGHFGVLMTASFVGAAFGAGLLAVVLCKAVARSWARALGIVALAGVALTDALMAVFATDLSVPEANGQWLRTESGRVHDAMARAHGLAWLVVAFAVPAALRLDARWRARAVASLGLGAVMVSALAARVASPPSWVGGTQRLWIATVLWWSWAHAASADAGPGPRTVP